MKPFVFDFHIGRQKPENIHNHTAPCPFCDREALTNILAEEGPIMWLMNKYPVNAGTWPTVIIETDRCDSEFAYFPLEEAADVIRFSLCKWEETIQSGRFASVLYFKNHGPQSGGSLRHPHSQIIGLETYDYKTYIRPEHLVGHPVWDGPGLHINMSTQPLIGFYEFNIVFDKKVNRTLLADRMQRILRFLMEGTITSSISYNYFFYDMDDPEHYFCKMVPRYTTSPLFVGYGIAQVADSDRVAEVLRMIRTYLE